MQLFRGVKRYKKRLEKQFTRQIGRKQFNFACDQGIVLQLEALARKLEVPKYPLAEHLLQIGLESCLVESRDDTLRELLQRHLVHDHLLVEGLNPVSERTSQQAHRIQAALNLVRLAELKGKNPEEIEGIIDGLLGK